MGDHLSGTLDGHRGPNDLLEKEFVGETGKEVPIIPATVSASTVLESLAFTASDLGLPPTLRDMAMVFLAGHGTTDDRNVFWYLPADAKPTSIRATAVS